MSSLACFATSSGFGVALTWGTAAWTDHVERRLGIGVEDSTGECCEEDGEGQVCPVVIEEKDVPKNNFGGR
jgi:hypothetical protein